MLIDNIGVSAHDINFKKIIHQMVDITILQDIDLNQPLEKLWV